MNALHTNFKYLGLLLSLSMFGLNSAYAKPAQYHNDKNGVLISGYDPVAYIKDNKAVEGKKEIQHTHEGTVIYFSSKANQEAFAQDPQKFLPQYKGWCAYAMASNGSLVDVDPEKFKVIDGKLYLFYNGWLGNTLKKWNKKPDAPQIKQADSNWQKKHI